MSRGFEWTLAAIATPVAIAMIVLVATEVITGVRAVERRLSTLETQFLLHQYAHEPLTDSPGGIRAPRVTSEWPRSTP